MSSELLRIVDSISRDKNIERESIFGDLEEAMASAARKHFGTEEEVDVNIDRETGEITAILNGESIDIQKLGRIPAQTAKQVMIQKLREDERGSIYAEYQERVGELVAGSAVRFEGSTIIVNLGRTEAILPRSEQVPGESHHPGERVRALIYEVKEDINQVKIILTRTHPDFIRRLFEQEVPEIAEQVIEIKALAREAGYRTKVAVMSHESKVDAVGACVGVRGSRIKNIVDELSGEKIDIVRWNESSKLLIENALRPAEVRETALCFELNRASVVVSEDQLSLAIGKRGQNVRLAARLTGWDIDILTPHEYAQGMEQLILTLRSVEGVDDTMIDKVMALGIVSVLDIDEVGAAPLVESLEVEESLAELIVKTSQADAQRLADAKEQSKATQEVLGAPSAGAGEQESSGTGEEADGQEVKSTGEEEVQEKGTEGVEQESASSAGTGEESGGTGEEADGQEAESAGEEESEDDSGEVKEDDSSSAEASQRSEGQV